MAKKQRRMRYVQTKSGEIYEDSAKFYQTFLPDDVSRVFLANIHPVTNGFTDVEDLVQTGSNSWEREKQVRIRSRTVRDASNNTSVLGGSVGFFSMDLPDIAGMIKDLDLMNENVNKAVRKGLHKGNRRICQAQKRRISGKSSRCAEAISESQIYTTKNGTLGITSGYQVGAFKTDSDGFNPGIIGTMFEYGRPGQSQGRTGKTMKQTRHGKTVEVNKGVIQPVPHIRRGFDEELEAACNDLIESVNEVIDKS